MIARLASWVLDLQPQCCVVLYTTEERDLHVAACACGWASGLVNREQQAVSAARGHMERN